MRLRVAVGSVVVAAAAVASTGAAATEAEVTMPGKFFSPRALDVLVGTTVTWRNSDRATHTVTEDDDDSFDSGHIRPGQTFAATFTKTGAYRYHCTIHRFMRGTLRVFEIVLNGPEDAQLAGRRVHLRGVAPAGVTEVLLQRVSPGPPEVVARAQPGTDGSFAFVVRAPEPGRYRVLAGKATSPVVAVRVAPRVPIERRARGIAVRAVPPRPGSRVALQEYDRELFSFVTVARGKLDATSRAVIAYQPERPARVRVLVLGTRGWADGTSREFVVLPR